MYSKIIDFVEDILRVTDAREVFNDLNYRFNTRQIKLTCAMHGWMRGSFLVSKMDTPKCLFFDILGILNAKIVKKN